MPVPNQSIIILFIYFYLFAQKVRKALMMKRKDLFYFAAKCLILKENPEYKNTILKQFESGNVDLERFVLLCSNHLILPTIYLNFKKFDLLHVFPEDFVEHLADLYNLNKKRNINILKQMREINKTLLNEDIQPLYLKGTANLIDNLYSDVGERMIGDIDFLVKEVSYQKSIELMHSIGYKSDIINYSGIETNKHFPRMHRSDVPADIEIHRVPVDLKYSKQFSSLVNFENKIQVTDIENCFIQSNEHRLIHNFIHSQLSNSGHLHKSLSFRDIYDFYLLAQRLNLKNTYHQIEKKNKAIIYINLINQILFNSTNKKLKIGKESKNYIYLFNWFLSHPRYHLFYIYFMSSVKILIGRPFEILSNALFTKSNRIGYTKRLKDPRWYKYKFLELKSNISEFRFRK